MPKQEVGSTKWLGNKMKAKGLQKLRWYCQMCQKQCRDENGFKCHRLSDGHQRQMQVFIQDPNKFMDDYSVEFEDGFMRLMSHRYRSVRVLANTVYMEFISDRHHTHMNSTIWVTLSNFVQYLGRTNQCTIDKTPKGWYIQYVDNTPEARMRAKAKEEMERREMTAAQQEEMVLRQAIEDGKASGGYQESEFTELQREEGGEAITFKMGAGASAASSAGGAAAKSVSSGASGEADKKNVLEAAFSTHSAASSKSQQKERKLSAMEQVMQEHEAAKRRKLGLAEEKARPPSPESEGSQPESWVAPGLIVKVMNKDLAGGKFYKKKAKIEKVKQAFSADVRMLEGGDLIRIDQELLETVIPNVGKPVVVIKGTHRSRKATMKAVDFENFCVTVELDDGTEMEGLGYDEICKFE
eukprot:gnl/TRDRNA2_/TRDRNA2_185377_c0_seq1.p1 gnl/TRDRNA2_/TRDRNA2_185377_c0~~gnl/TRDRNA2_/TRDRNA2_185377_c0_seq1.p1  ORF type:complete len:411 (+),score=106.90 gnl/TRDRNA2_/TRDRNA2_185377_c0_seq1:98-1330(+)